MKKMMMLVIACWSAWSVRAALELAAPFADGMVLQRGMKVPVWGWAEKGARVTVSFAGQRCAATAGADGRWRVDLAPMTASNESRTLVVQVGAGETKQVQDVLVGEVWYVSGQSNCELPLTGKNPRFRERQGALVAQMTVKPRVRYCYACDYKQSKVPQTRAQYPVAWRPFTPENLGRMLRPSGRDGFSAMGVYYALELHNALDVPVGVVGSWWGATRIEPWTPACGFDLAGVKPVPDPTHAGSFHEPCTMWNEMVAPWCPMAMRGFIWYQGCSNSTQPETYTGYMHALYRGWAKMFENPALKLCFVQLTSWNQPRVVPLQEAQARFAAEEPNAAMAVIEDVGNLDDIHPHEKLTVAKRLAAQALKRDYGFDWLESDSPVVRDWRVVGDTFVLEFDHAQALYFYNPDRSAQNGFEICGADGVWQKAEFVNANWYRIWLGTIREGHLLGGDTIAVRAEGVPHPQKLRYLHSHPWYAAVHNQSDLPLGPFHVDAPQSRGRTDTVLTDGWTADGEPVTVPHCWNIEDACDGKGIPPGRKGCSSADSPSYERKCVKYVRALPDPTPGRRQFLRCEGASVKATVTVNGRTLGTHKGAFTAFAFELTDVLKPQGNTLEIAVDNAIDKDIPPFGGDFAIYGGLYRDVHFIETDKVCIDSLTDGADNIVVEADPATGAVVARVKVLGGTNEVQRFRFDDVKRWSPETPNLYFLNVKVDQQGCHDAISVPFGFRTVEFRADGFYLNGQKRVLRGVNRHQDRAGKGWALTRADHRADFAMIKDLGADAVRFCHYPHATAEYTLADELGFLVWAEAPNVDGVTHTPAFRENLLTAVREFVAQQRNHPSIFVWSVFNEVGNDFKDPDPAATVRLLAEVKALYNRLDPTRLTTSATCIFNKKVPGLNDVTDTLAWNLYPGWYGGGAEEMTKMMDQRFADTGRKLQGVSEYGCGASANQHGDPFVRTAPWSKWHPDEYQARCHWGNYLQLSQRQDLWGTFIWCMFDFASDMRHEGDRDGINDKGLVTFDRTAKKSGFHFYRVNWNPEPQLHLVGPATMSVTNATCNVMAFSNKGKVRLRVNGREVGVQEPDAVKTVVFRDVPLAPGKNVLRVESHGAVRERIVNR